MRPGEHDVKEFDKLVEWKNYINTYMMNAIQQDSGSEVKIVTGRGETIAVWQKQGFGYVDECRTPERLSKQIEKET